MSFWAALGGGLKKVAAGIHVATDAIQPWAPLISAIPGIGGPFGAIFNLVVTVEDLSEPATSGAERKAAVLAILKLKYPKLDIEKVGPLVDQQVTILNALAAAVEESEKK